MEIKRTFRDPLIKPENQHHVNFPSKIKHLTSHGVHRVNVAIAYRHCRWWKTNVVCLGVADHIGSDGDKTREQRCEAS